MKRLNTLLPNGSRSLWRSLGRNACRCAFAYTLMTGALLDAAPPELKTQGNQIVVKATGAPVRLTGVNIVSLEWGNGENLMTSLEVAVGTWKVNVIRLPVSRATWLNAGNTAYRATVDAFIARASELNAYVILDLHEYGKALTADATFWTDAANRYKNNPAVLFGLLNEPHGTTWAVWRNGDSAGPGLQGLLTAVRATGANNIVLAGGLEYAYMITGILEGGYALTDTGSGNGVVYDTHIYPWKTYIQSNVGTAAQTVPVMIGELGHPGGTTFSGQASFEAEGTWVPKWMDWVNAHNLNWTGWCFYPGSDPRMLTDWSYTPSANWGVAAKQHLQSYADPDALRVVGGTVIGTTGTRGNPSSGVVTDWQTGAVAAFDGSYDTVFDAPTASDSWAGLDLVTPRRITQIKYMPKAGAGALMVGGFFQGSNSATFASGVVTLYAVTAAPTATGGVYTTVPVSDTGAYRYVRYLGPPNSHCNVASVLFYSGVNTTPDVTDDVIVIDNGGPGCEITGSWTTSSLSGYHGSKWINDGNGGKGAKSVRYTPSIPAAGMYEVYAWWSAHETRTTAAPYVITYAGGSATVEVNQRENGSQWRSLGTFPFNAGTAGNVLLHNGGTTGYVSADAVLFARRDVVEEEVDIIMDKLNTDTEGIITTGSWTFSTGVSGYYGPGFYNDGNAGKGTKSVRFTPTLPSAGDYEVYARWTEHSTRTEQAPFLITYDGGSTTVTRNQKQDGGDWRLLGTFPFAAGTAGNVLVHNTGTTGYVVVDAVRFHKPGNAPVPPVAEIILDTDNPLDASYVTMSGNWIATTATAQYNGVNYYQDGDTRDGTKSVTFAPNLPVTGTYDVYLRWTSGTSRANNVPVTVNHAGGTAQETVNQKTYGGQWRLLGAYNFNAGTGGGVTLSNAGTNGYVIADAILFDLQ